MDKINTKIKIFNKYIKNIKILLDNIKNIVYNKDRLRKGG